MQRVIREADLEGHRWQEYDSVSAIRIGDSEGHEVFTGRRSRAVRSYRGKLRLLVQVAEPDDVSTHGRIRAAIGL